jgi:hypothetical protein
VNIIHPATGETAVSIDDAKLALWQAQKLYEAAQEDADAARQIETAALNQLNKAQRVFDTAVSDVRAQAPEASDWKQAQRRGETADLP